jgi:hypothetical protein
MENRSLLDALLAAAYAALCPSGPVKTSMSQSQLQLKSVLHQWLEQSLIRGLLDMFGGSIPIPDLLIVPNSQTRMTAEIRSDLRWRQIFTSEHYSVFQHIA